MIKIGVGYDIHRFETEPTKQHIMLGGVRIPYERGIVAHSDGDVCLHAMADALLGALALGDIGQHFPDTDAQYAGKDSRILLRAVLKLIHERGYEVGNVDATIIAERPKLQPHIVAMREVIAQDLQVSIDDISVKATTNEGMDATGQRQAIAVHAVALLRKK